MPMPHRTQMQIIKRRIHGVEGKDRTRELRSILDTLPNYKNGPYADIRKWVMEEIEASHTRSRVVHRDSIAVRREGAAQVALVGAPNSGKSSLLEALSHVRIKVGEYAFTTLRPVPALTRIHGVLIQLVEIPGLIPGAAEDRGGGRALLGVLRMADAVVYCHDAREPAGTLEAVRSEVGAAGIDLPGILAATKMDEAEAEDAARLRAAVPDLPVTPVSVLDDASLEAFRDAVWGLTGLIAVYLRHNGVVDPEPLALEADATVEHVAAGIHKDIAASCRGARLWRPESHFVGQHVGRSYLVQDGDTVEIVV